MSLHRRLGVHMLQFQRGGRAGVCWRKKRWDTEAEAEVARVRQIESRERRGEQAAAPLETYPCPNCSGWHVGRDPDWKRMDQANLKDTLAQGGVVTVMLGKDFDLPADYAYHPAVHGVVANNCDPHNLGKDIPSNTKVIVLTENINRPVYESIKTECARRRMLYLIRKTPAAMNEALREIVPKRIAAPPPPGATTLGAALATAKPVAVPDKPAAAPPPKANGPATGPVADVTKRDERTTKTGVDPRLTVRGTLSSMAPRGAIAELVKEADLTKSIAEEGRRLFRLAQQRGIQTTIGSITQGVSKRKRDERRSATPESIVPEQLRVLKLFDDTIDGLLKSIEGLRNVRDYVERTESRMDEMEAKFDLLAQTFSDLTAAAKPTKK